MLCHVTRPDSVVMEVEVDGKANGEDCLNKVGWCGIHITFSYYDTILKHSVIFRQGGSVFLRNFKRPLSLNLSLIDSSLILCVT